MIKVIGKAELDAGNNPKTSPSMPQNVQARSFAPTSIPNESLFVREVRHAANEPPSFRLNGERA